MERKCAGTPNFCYQALAMSHHGCNQLKRATTQKKKKNGKTNSIFIGNYVGPWAAKLMKPVCRCFWAWSPGFLRRGRKLHVLWAHNDIFLPLAALAASLFSTWPWVPKFAGAYYLETTTSYVVLKSLTEWPYPKLWEIKSLFPRKTSKAIDFPYLKIGDCSIPNKISLEEMIKSSEPNLHLVKLENSLVSSGALAYTKRSRCRTISLVVFFFSLLLAEWHFCFRRSKKLITYM